MILKSAISTDEDPLEQRNVSDLINAGYALDLILEQKIDEYGVNQYYLYAKYRNHLRPVFTQRNAHRAFVNLERAVNWGKRMGFRRVSIAIDYEKYPDPDEE